MPLWCTKCEAIGLEHQTEEHTSTQVITGAAKEWGPTAPNLSPRHLDSNRDYHYYDHYNGFFIWVTLIKYCP